MYKKLILCCSLFLSLATAVIAQPEGPLERGPRFVEATGSAVIKVPATKVSVALTITRSAIDAKTALQQNAVVAEKVIGTLKNNSTVSDLVTDTVQLYEQKKYDNIKNESITTGYESRNQISFAVDLKSAGEVIDETIKLGANNVLSVAPKAENAALEAARLEAITLATQKAKITAEKALAALGLTAKDVQMIRIDPESSGYIPSPQPMLRAFAADAAERVASTPIEGGTNSVQARALVRITY